MRATDRLAVEAARAHHTAKEKRMTKLYNRVLALANDERAQDMVEYALLAGFIAVAAGAVLPGISTSISQIFSKMASLTTAAAQK
jgi:pilus assembly protein Flp/PilA